MKIHKKYNIGITKKGEIINLKTMKPYCQWIDNVGYYQVKFKERDKTYYKRVHRIVAETFIENIENKKQVNHIDGNKLNNNISNLEWVSNKENTQKGYDLGLYKNKRRCEIKVINKETKEETIYKSIRSCAEILNLNRKTITSILKGIKKTNNYKYEFEYVYSV